MMAREMREDKFEPDFDNYEGDDEADVGFKVDCGDKVEQSGNENGDGNPGVVHSLSARGGKDGGFDSFAGTLKVSGKKIFESDGGDNDNEGGDGVVGGFG